MPPVAKAPPKYALRTAPTFAPCVEAIGGEDAVATALATIYRALMDNPTAFPKVVAGDSIRIAKTKRIAREGIPPLKLYFQVGDISEDSVTEDGITPVYLMYVTTDDEEDEG